MAEGDAAVIDVVGRKLQRDLIAGEDADVMLSHFAAGVRDQLMSVVQRHAETRIRQDFIDYTTHFDQFFFCQKISPVDNLNAMKLQAHG